MLCDVATLVMVWMIENRAFLSSSFRRFALPEKFSDMQAAVMAGLAGRIVMGKLAHRFALPAYVPDILMQSVISNNHYQSARV